MAVYVSNIVIEQGFDFDTSFQLEDTRSNAFLNLTGAATTAQIRKHPIASTAVSFGTSVSSPEQGIISITMTAAKTATLKAGRYVYDVKLTTLDGSEYKAVEGAALVRAGVTR